MSVTEKEFRKFTVEAMSEFEKFQEYMTNKVNILAQNIDKVAEGIKACVLEDCKRDFINKIRKNSLNYLTFYIDFRKKVTEKLQTLLNENVTEKARKLSQDIDSEIENRTLSLHKKIPKEIIVYAPYNLIPLRDTFASIARPGILERDAKILMSSEDWKPIIEKLKEDGIIVG